MVKHHIFISYSSNDKQFALHLAKDLKAIGAKVWLDETELKIGDSLFDSLSIALQDCLWIIVVLSKTSVSSEWVKKEIAAAISREVFEKRTLLLPLLLDNCDVPPLLKDKLYADFRGSYGFGLEKLIATIEPSLQKDNNLEIMTLKAGLLPNVYSGLKLKANHLARIQYAVNLIESLLEIEVTLFSPFKAGQILTAESLNCLMNPIDNLRKKLDMKSKWQRWPVHEGQILTSEILNELFASVNELINKLITTHSSLLG